MNILPARMYVCHVCAMYVPGAHGVQKRATDPLELVAVSHRVATGTKPKSSARATGALKCAAIRTCSLWTSQLLSWLTVSVQCQGHQLPVYYLGTNDKNKPMLLVDAVLPHLRIFCLVSLNPLCRGPTIPLVMNMDNC